ncbi:putative serine dehydratase domain-containing protein [Lipomyces oligophaga]|uniref:putative serine dehydratase domain-containing protein n=1 Tax=Lipomyces oligophaga TaxID=45792 RepID=UPI0034CD3291
MNSKISLERYRADLLSRYEGKPISELPTPSFVVDLDIVRANCSRMLNGVEALSLYVGSFINFRPHVKTHKTVEITRLELGELHESVVASTLAELRGLGPLYDSGQVKDVLYGIPPAASKLSELAAIADYLDKTSDGVLKLIVDTVAEINMLKEFHEKYVRTLSWNVFVKIDLGDNRAGQMVSSPDLKEIIDLLLDPNMTNSVNLVGFYAHRGHSYSATGEESVISHLQQELQGVLSAAEIVYGLAPAVASKLTVSIGATPTAHAMATAAADNLSGRAPSSFVVADMLKNLITAHKLDGKIGALEIHAGNYAMLDLQQVATGLISTENIAGKVIAEVLAYYPDRNEYLIDAGVLALAREPGRIEGIAGIEGEDQTGARWAVDRVSQEHGIITRIDNKDPTEPLRSWSVGDKVVLYPQHACITSSMYQWYFAVEQGIVKDILIPWRGW